MLSIEYAYKKRRDSDEPINRWEQIALEIYANATLKNRDNKFTD